MASKQIAINVQMLPVGFTSSNHGTAFVALPTVKNRLVVPASALAGGAFLMLADTLARTVVAPRELNIGVITSLVGAPIFVYLLRRTS